MFIPKTMLSLPVHSIANTYFPPVNPLGHAFDADFDADIFQPIKPSCFLEDLGEEPVLISVNNVRGQAPTERAAHVSLGAHHEINSGKPLAPSFLLSEPNRPKSGGWAKFISHEFPRDNHSKRRFDINQFDVFPPDHHMYYGEGSDRINLSEEFLTLTGLIKFLRPFIGLDRGFWDYLLEFELSQQLPCASAMVGSLVLIDPESKRVVSELPIFISHSQNSICRRPQHRVPIGEDVEVVLYFWMQNYQGAQRLCLGVDLHVSDKLIRMHFAPDGHLVYSPGNMQHFFSSAFPMVAPIKETWVVEQKVIVGNRLVTLNGLYHPIISGELLSSALIRFEIGQDRKLGSFKNRQTQDLTEEEQDAAAWADSHGLPLSLLGIKEDTNEYTWGKGRDQIILDCLHSVELTVRSLNNMLSAPTHTVWQEIERLNELLKITNSVTFEVFARETYPYYLIRIYVFSSSDREWKNYCDLYYDSYGNRISSFRNITEAKAYKDQFLRLSEHSSLKDEFRLYGLEHAEIFSHNRLNSRKDRRDLSYQIRNKDHIARLQRFFKAIKEEGAQFFDGLKQKNPLRGEDLLLRYVSFYVTDDVFELIDAYLDPKTGSEIKESVRGQLLERFSFTRSVQLIDLPNGQHKRDLENKRSREVAIADVMRVHKRHTMLNAFGLGFVPQAYSVMFCFDEGMPVIPGGTPPRSRTRTPFVQQGASSGTEVRLFNGEYE